METCDEPALVATGAVRGGTSILYAALGETISERAGVVNLGIEGSMLCGALGGLRGRRPRPATPGSALAAGAVAGGLLSLVHAFFVLNRGSNQLATGLVVLFLGLGHHVAVRRGLRAGRRRRR